MLNHYKAMIPCHSHLQALFTALNKKNIKFKWTTEHQQAFDSLKNSFTHEVVLTYPDFSIPFKIYTDASKYQIKSIITQKHKPFSVYSRKLTDPQMRYTVTELKLLGIVETCHEYKCILLGHLISIYTNHKNITFLNFNANHVSHWELIVEEYMVPTLSTFPGNAISLLMLSLTYQNLMNHMTNQHFLKKSLHSMNNLMYF
jgi:hypothetical protein